MINLTAGAVSGYHRDLALLRDGDNRVWSACVSSERSAGTLQWRVVGVSDGGPVHSVRTMGGSPASPQLVEYRPGEMLLLWLEYADAAGSLYSLAIGTPNGQDAVPTRVFPAMANVGAFSCASDREGKLWLAAELWAEGQVDLALGRFDGSEWEDRGCVETPSSFHARPCLRAGFAANTPRFLLSWDEYLDGRYRVGTAFLSEQGLSVIGSVGSGPAWHNLSTVCPSTDGNWYLAWLQEELVKLPGDALSHHSEIHVAHLDQRACCWQEVGTVDIDDTLNPWMAAYLGFRRFPYLVPNADGGVWLLRENKQDSRSMGPGPGRLLARRFPNQDGTGDLILIDGRSHFVIESPNLPRRDLVVASKTQLVAKEQRLPFYLHSVEMAEPHPQCESPTFARPAWRPRPKTNRSRLESEGLKLFFGDPHIHGRMSGDLDGEPDELYHFARDIAGLDFAALTENDYTYYTEPLAAEAWERMRRSASFFNKPNQFTVFLAWEYTKHTSPDSHRCVILPDAAGEVMSWHDDTPTPQELVAKLQNREALLHHHHNFGFDVSDDNLERNIEICSGWENWMTSPAFRASLHELLGKGYRLGFIGGSDNHERNPGLGGPLTGAWAESNTRHDIFQAFKQRHVFATTGLRPSFAFRVNGVLMGGSVECQAAPRVNVQVECEREIELLEIIRDGSIVHTVLCEQSPATLDWLDDACIAGKHYYYCHVKFSGEEAALDWNLAPVFGVHAWSSPVWVLRRDG